MSDHLTELPLHVTRLVNTVSALGYRVEIERHEGFIRTIYHGIPKEELWALAQEEYSHE